MFRMERREELFRMERRRRRRRVMVGGAVVVGSTEAMVKLSESEARQIQAATGQNPEDLSHDELQQTMQAQGIAGQPVTDADQQAMAAAEAGEGDGGGGQESAAPPPAAQAAAPPPAAQVAAAPPAAGGGLTDDQLGELEKLGQLHTEGVLTDEEFAAAKAKVLGL
jgi:hypothetical protein